MTSTQTSQTKTRTENIPLEARLQTTNQNEKYDGRDKAVSIHIDYLGATKQTPQLLREIVALMPNITIISREFTNEKGILLDELKRTNQAVLERMDSTDEDDCKKPLIRIALEVDSMNKHGFKYYGPEPPSHNVGLQLAVDPLKFEARPQLTAKEQQVLKRKYGVADARVIIGGSLKSSEYKTFCEAIRYANRVNPDVRTIGMLVPRHCPEAAYMQVKELKIPYIIDRDKNSQKDKKRSEILIITKQGILQDLYSICDVAIIGDTLWPYPKSGQNPLEPAFYGKRIISGPRQGEWNDTAYKGLAKSGLLTHITNQEELNTEVARQVSEQEMNLWRTNAQAFIQSQQGAAKRYAKYVQQALYEPEKLLALQNSIPDNNTR